MIAVAKIGGRQSIVKIGEILEVDKIAAAVGEKVEFETFLVADENGENCEIGAPFLENVKIEAKILEHGRGKKIRVFKMKPRKRYRRTIGHRQDFTKIEILKIKK